MLICIDAGHGKNAPGKRCLKSLDHKETREWALNDRIADRLQGMLATYDCGTMRVDDTTGDTDVTLGERVYAANKEGADVYLSLHHNAGADGTAAGGIVVYTCKGCQAKSTQLQQAVYDATVAATGLKGNRATPLAERELYVLRYTTMPAVLVECGFMDSSSDVPVILTETFADQMAAGLTQALVETFGLTEKVAMVELPERQVAEMKGHVNALRTLLGG